MGCSEKEIQETIYIYERLRKFQYSIEVEDGRIIEFAFAPGNYHHLVGFHHILDMKDIANPSISMDRFYRMAKNGQIDFKKLLASSHFSYIQERIQSFEYLESMLVGEPCQVVIDFDPLLAESDIEAKFLLFKRVGNFLEAEPVTYHNLFIGENTSGRGRHFFPATYLVEHSTKYQNRQEFLNCVIHATEKNKK